MANKVKFNLCDVYYALLEKNTETTAEYATPVRQPLLSTQRRYGFRAQYRSASTRRGSRNLSSRMASNITFCQIIWATQVIWSLPLFPNLSEPMF